MSDEFVYIARCAAHKHRDTNKPLIKIGLTKNLIDIRMKKLSNTSAPDPFECLFLFKCPDCKWLESELHEIFKDLKYTNDQKYDREYFAVSPECVVKVLNMYEGSFCDLNDIQTAKVSKSKPVRKRRREISESKKSKILTLWRKDYTQIKISEELNVSVNHVAKTIKAYKEEKGLV